MQIMKFDANDRPFVVYVTADHGVDIEVISDAATPVAGEVVARCRSLGAARAAADTATATLRSVHGPVSDDGWKVYVTPENPLEFRVKACDRFDDLNHERGDERIVGGAKTELLADYFADGGNRMITLLRGEAYTLLDEDGVDQFDGAPC
ncbi:hypothetical protein ACIGG9_24790 [Pseudonocardia alni]|uniref:hypothetical protein n=1 Tax=Pseudonocardia alni TaxID=33907 RepID=UPI00340DAE18